MLGHNDEVIRGKKRKPDDPADPNKNQWKIHVRTPKGDTFPLMVQPSNRISQIKEKIKAKKGIPPEDQRLSFEGTPLKDTKTLVGSAISTSMVALLLKGRYEIGTHNVSLLVTSL